MLRRYLEYRGYEVTFVQNFTDVDDKIIKRANEEGVTVRPDRRKVYRGVLEGRHSASASARRRCIPRRPRTSGTIIEIVKTLVEKGYAYEVNGDVYYRTLKVYRTTASSPTSRSRICSPAHAST